jgi:hypothetical protein
VLIGAGVRFIASLGSRQGEGRSQRRGQWVFKRPTNEFGLGRQFGPDVGNTEDWEGMRCLLHCMGGTGIAAQKRQERGVAMPTAHLLVFSSR